MKTLLFIFRVVLWTPPAVLMLAGGSYVYGVLNPPVRFVDREVPVHIEKPKRAIEELISEIAPQHDISPLLLGAIVEKESNGKINAIRFEPGQMSRAAKITSNPEQQRMYASSHGVAQIMGWWSPEFGLSWHELYDPETNLRIASKILKQCMDRHAKKSKLQQIHGALTCYNGSTTYADAVMRRLGELLIERSV